MGEGLTEAWGCVLLLAARLVRDRLRDGKFREQRPTGDRSIWLEAVSLPARRAGRFDCGDGERRLAMETLPTGIQSFRTIRENGLRYVDKTGYAAMLVNRGRRFFLSRPRRFGKSLFVDTLKELFEGNEKLFRGLAIHGEWDWSVRYPVLRLDFGAGEYSERGVLKRRIFEILNRAELEAERNFWMAVYRRAVQRVASLASIFPGATTLEYRFSEIIRRLKNRTGQPVVVLVDEYDKPILSAIDSPEIARKNRETLQSLYSTLKTEDDSIRFCLITGVTEYEQASVLSDANHLTDISEEPEYSAICGCTEFGLDSEFGREIAGERLHKDTTHQSSYSSGAVAGHSV